ncbi:hypothetical protein AAG570_013312 [Ranatra chinensis]|uniref:Uncharacterized protein n=1 Tax=Ranatra chinensis TaxID=642074 RepID=A0ABD0YGV9_9HEMI
MSNNTDLHFKKYLVKTFIWSVLLYGSESWTLEEAEKRRIEALKLWCYRRMLKIAWVDKVSNEEVLQRIGETSWINLKRRRNTWMGDILRHEGFMKTILERRDTWDRPSNEYIDQIMEDMGCLSYLELKRCAEDREGGKIAADQSYR